MSRTGALRLPVGARPAPGRPRPAAPPAPPTRRLTILHLITRLERGGSSECTLLQASGAARRGHRVIVAHGRSPADDPLLAAVRREGRVTFREVRGLARPVRPWRDLIALFGLTRILRAIRPDIVHTHTSKAGALGRLAALPARVPRLIHQPHGHLFYGYYGRAGSLLVVLAERLLAPAADAQIVLTPRGLEEHVGHGVGRRGDFHVIRSGIDLRRFRTAGRRRPECRARLGYGPDDLVAGTLCRLEAIKGVDLLLRGFLQAAPARPRLRLHLAGDGPLRPVLEDMLRAAPPAIRARVTLAPGWVAPEEILPALDLFFLVSRNEGMGRALVEAMACGLPVVGTAVGGIPDVLDGGEAGLLIPPEDPGAVARALQQLADAPGRRRDLGHRGRSRALLFGAGRMNRTLLRLYREIVS
ncbi:MAG: glycosyltransferase [Candidatus Polarisedimenticolia bacterium]